MEYDPRIIIFFKKHNLYNKEMFEYLKKNTTMIDYQKEEQRTFIGCFYQLDDKNVLTKIHLTLPYINDDLTIIISIHEIIHGIELFQNLNQKINIMDTSEILPMLYEKIYVEENGNEELQKQYTQFEYKINRQDKKYLIALMLREELYKEYNYDMKQIQRKARQLVRKYSNSM